MDRRLAEWFAGDDTGMSSEAIALFLSAGVATGNTPNDPADLGRCLRLLALIPEWTARMPEMAGARGLWPTFARRWCEMADLMDDEVGRDWSKGQRAERTYALMKEVEDEARIEAGWTRHDWGWSMEPRP